MTDGVIYLDLPGSAGQPVYDHALSSGVTTALTGVAATSLADCLAVTTLAWSELAVPRRLTQDWRSSDGGSTAIVLAPHVPVVG